MTWVHLPDDPDISASTPASAPAASAPRCSAGAQCATSSTTSSASACCKSVSPTGGSTTLRSGTTQKLLKGSPGEKRSIFSQADSRASHFHTPATKSPNLTIATSGLQQPESFAKYDRESSSWRTSPTSLLESMGISEPFSGTWPISGMMWSGTVYKLTSLGRLMNDAERGFLASGGGGRLSSQESARTEEAGESAEFAVNGTPLADAPAPLKKVWSMSNSTARCGQDGKWPTPTVNDAKNSTLPPSQSEWDHIPGKLLRMGHPPGSIMNPALSEWLMILPTGWTELEPLETPKSRSKWLQHSRSLVAACVEFWAPDNEE